MPPDRPLRPEDLPAVREALRAFRAWQTGRGVVPSPYWVERVSRGVADQGLAPKRGAPLAREPGED